MATLKRTLEIIAKGSYQATLNYFNLLTSDQAEAKANRAYESGFYDGNDDPQSGEISRGGLGYRSVGQRGKRDFSKLTNSQIINSAWNSYQSNPIAERALEFRMSAILGRNTAPETSDENLQEILDQFWKRNLANNHNLKRFVIAHSLFGELILPVFVRESDGRVLLGYIDQADVEENGVVFHPQNNLERWAVVLKQDSNGDRKVYRIIREDEGTVYQDTVIPPRYPEKLIIWQQATLEPWEQALLKANGLTEYTGSCFYIDKNNLANQPRGYSDLLQSIDWLDANDTVLFSLAEREELMNYFSWLVKLSGATPEQVRKRASELRISPPMGKGQANVHNDSEEWSYVSADLKQPGSIAAAEATKKQALEGLNQPGFWHGDEDTANRATAQSADSPVNRTLEHEQADMAAWVIHILQFVADQAEIAGSYKPEEGTTITVQVPEIVKDDTLPISQAYQNTVNALVVSVFDLKVVSRDTAAQVVSKIIAEYGVQYNPAEEIEKIDEQVKEMAMATQADVNQFLADTIERNGNV
jgi:hypothetical protein